MIICPHCGRTTGDETVFCPNCGKVIHKDQKIPANPPQNSQSQPMPVQNSQITRTFPAATKKHSGMGITAFILSLTFFLSPIGFLLGIVDLIINKKNKHGLSIAAVAVGAVLSTILIIVISSASSTKTDNPAPSQIPEYEQWAADNPAMQTPIPTQTPSPTPDPKLAYIDSCEEVDYNAVSRDPDAYKGKKIRIEGTVVQVSEGYSNSITLRISTSSNGYDDIWYVKYKRKDSESRILEDDYVEVFGKCTGVETYTALFGNSITIPSLEAEYVNLFELSDPEYAVNVVKFDTIPEAYGAGYEFLGIVEIKNTGTSNIYISDGSFDIEDASGRLLQTETFIYSFPDIIRPGEKAYLYSAYETDLNETASGMLDELVLVPKFSAKATFVKPSDYSVSDISVVQGNYGVDLTGRVTNNTHEDASIVYVSVVYYDSNDQILGLDQESIYGLDAGKTASFEISGWNDSFNANDVARYEVIARDGYYGF